MSASSPFPPEFYLQSAEEVAKGLLGAVLVRSWGGVEARTKIVETEAYSGREDEASHGRRRPTPRNQALYGRPGLSYVYKSRGIHWMFNIVAEPEGQPAAVLIRAVEPLTGFGEIASRRPDRDRLDWTNGPGKLCQALDIDFSHHQLDVSSHDRGLWIEQGERIPEDLVRRGPRIGMGKTPEPWYSYPRRWWWGGNLYVSVGSGRLG